MIAQVKLKPLKLDDLDNVMTWVNDPEVIGNFANFDKRITRGAEEEFMGKLLGSETDKVYSIFNEAGNYIGQVGINQIHWPTRVGRLGLIVGNRAEWGKGYAQAALKEILRIGFEEQRMHKLWIITFEENKRMQHIMSKVGFEVEGLLKEEYLNRGGYHNVIRMAILERDYFARQKEGGK